MWGLSSAEPAPARVCRPVLAGRVRRSETCTGAERARGVRRALVVTPCPHAACTLILAWA